MCLQVFSIRFLNIVGILLTFLKNKLLQSVETILNLFCFFFRLSLAINHLMSSSLFHQNADDSSATLNALFSECCNNAQKRRYVQVCIMNSQDPSQCLISFFLPRSVAQVRFPDDNLVSDDDVKMMMMMMNNDGDEDDDENIITSQQQQQQQQQRRKEAMLDPALLPPTVDWSPIARANYGKILFEIMICSSMAMSAASKNVVDVIKMSLDVLDPARMDSFRKGLALYHRRLIKSF